MELMSPAGNREAFLAALENGSDAVYLGLNMFNARRPARNFRTEELPEIISLARSKRTKIYVTLNIDLKTDELEDAASVLMFLKQSGADAVIIKDLALVYIINRYFPGFEFHFSTQTGIANSAAMAAAEDLGASRVVLARELELSELKPLVRPYFPKTEVFVQGSMCFSFSGRCLMSSWFGGKSANRGTCQAPCRFRFAKEGSEEYGAHFSMKDMNLSERLKELEDAGVHSLKIEGRLKSAEWVGAVTKYYRSLLDGEKPEGPDPSSFSGREQGEGFYGGLTELITSRNSGTSAVAIKSKQEDRRERQYWYDMTITAGENIGFYITSDHGDAEFSVKLKAVKNEGRGVYLSELENRIRNTAFGGLFLGRFELDSDILIPKSQLNNIISSVGSAVAPLSRREKKFLKNLKLPPKLEYELRNHEPSKKNTQEISFACASVLRISSNDIPGILEGIRDAGIRKVIVTEPDPYSADLYKRLAAKVRVEISLFPVLFEKELDGFSRMIEELEHTNNISYEANDLGHLKLLRKTSKKIDCGPGLSPYNLLAAKQLQDLGLQSAYVPLEADKETLEGLKDSPLPLRMTVYGRIPLFYTRAASEDFKEGSFFSDREGFGFYVRKYSGISIFTSNEYFTIHGSDSQSVIHAHEMIIDLTGEKNILYLYEKLKKDPSKFPGLNFNLNRKLY